jgi:hypothetical protein
MFLLVFYTDILLTLYLTMHFFPNLCVLNIYIWNITYRHQEHFIRVINKIPIVYCILYLISVRLTTLNLNKIGKKILQMDIMFFLLLRTIFQAYVTLSGFGYPV